MNRWIVWICYAAFWTTLLLLPGDSFEPLGWNEPSTQKMLISKTGHVGAYAVFAWITGWLRVPARYRWMLVFLLMVHGTVTELLQLYVIENRHGQLEDVGLNNFGVLLGMIASWKWWTDPN